MKEKKNGPRICLKAHNQRVVGGKESVAEFALSLHGTVSICHQIPSLALN